MGFVIYLCLAVLGSFPAVLMLYVRCGGAGELRVGRRGALEMNWNNEANHNAISRRRPWLFALAVTYMDKKIIEPPCVIYPHACAPTLACRVSVTTSKSFTVITPHAYCMHSRELGYC